MANKFADTCGTCGKQVPAQAGVVRNVKNKWTTYHQDCLPVAVAPPAGEHPGWHHTLLAALDLETTGPDETTARVVTAAIVRSDGLTRTWLVNPGVPIPEGATAVHGITTAHARDNGMPAAEALTQIADELHELAAADVPLVIYRASYDLTVLDHEMARHGLPELPQQLVIDPFVLDKQVERFRSGSRRLVDVSRYYGIELSLQDAHTAAGDALAALRVAQSIAARYERVAAMSTRKLQAAQAKWHDDDAAGLQEYLRSKGSTEIVNRQWPRQRVSPETATDARQ